MSTRNRKSKWQYEKIIWLSYDPAGRLGALVVSGLETRFLYDGGQLAAEANASGAIIRRYFLRAP